MKEFSALTGGRYTYADDLENIQELALVFAQLFDDCDNFIMSGCEIDGDSIGAGYVFINGRIRHFSGATGITSWPQYICEQNETEDVPYESGGHKIGRKIYGCALVKVVPVVQDTLTGAVPQSILITSSGGLRMKDAFLGKYALLLNPTNPTQTVDSAVTFAKSVRVNKELIANEGISIKLGTLQAILKYDGSTFNIKCTGGDNNYCLSIMDGGGFKFFANDTLITTIDEDGISFTKPVTCNKGVFGGLAITGNDFYQNSANAVSDIYINRYSYNGQSSHYRNTHICNGQGKNILSITGENGQTDIFGAVHIAADVAEGLVLKANLLKSNDALTNAIVWTDSSNSDMARIGFLSASDKTFSIQATAYNIDISGHSAVNIGPSIKENGVLLSEKYVLQQTLTNLLKNKADAVNVYSIEVANDKFATKNGGLAQFISSEYDAASCRSHIGALGKVDLEPFVKLDSFLADMAKTEEDKQKIRKNIGAASAGDFQPKMLDTGWIHIQDGLYARQIGNIVSIQGITKTIHSGTVFRIPNAITPPPYTLRHTISLANDRNWICKIMAGQRTCFTEYCNKTCNNDVEFLITYMI